MKKRPLVVEGMRCIAVVALLSGCARLQHQTSDSEPHALVVIAPDSGIKEQPTVMEIDGLPVKLGREYRITPGEHQVIIVEMVRVDETFISEAPSLYPNQSNPTLSLSQTDAPELSNTYPSIGSNQPVDLRVQSWEAYYITNSLTFESGWRYVLDGEQVDKKRLSARGY